jgi:uncharacterized protein (DUF983 family)
VAASQSSRSLMSDLTRGFLGRRPCCGEGGIFGAFLKVNRCSVCGEELHHHRADDFPAYLVILTVGHRVVPMALSVETELAPSYWIHRALWLPLTLGMAIGLLQPIKGAVVAVQWHLGWIRIRQKTPKLERLRQRAFGARRVL